jgi:heme/copper-type cytochrome/quinol oxidase subunit 2
VFLVVSVLLIFLVFCVVFLVGSVLLIFFVFCVVFFKKSKKKQQQKPQRFHTHKTTMTYEVGDNR